MKQLMSILLGITFLFGASYADENSGLKDHRDKESYSLGYQFGQYLQFQGVDIDLEVYASAIRDALEGNEPLMSREEIRAVIKGLQQRVEAAGEKQSKEKAARNLEEGRRFLAENSGREGIRTLPNGLQYKVLVEGAGKTPQAADTVTVNYMGTLIDGTEFDSSYKRGQPATFKVNGVIRGWTQALQLMKEGSKWQLFVPPDLAYGERGAGLSIPPNSALIFEVELISVQ